MALTESQERARQAVMRFRELLDLMGNRLAHGEKVYAALFDGLSPEVMAQSEKARQGAAGLAVIEDRQPFLRAALDMRWYAREMSQAFEELHDIVVSIDPAIDDAVDSEAT